MWRIVSMWTSSFKEGESRYINIPKVHTQIQRKILSKLHAWQIGQMFLGKIRNHQLCLGSSFLLPMFYGGLFVGSIFFFWLSLNFFKISYLTQFWKFVSEFVHVMGVTEPENVGGRVKRHSPREFQRLGKDLCMLSYICSEYLLIKVPAISLS